MGIAVILPSRGRPEQAREAVQSVIDTRRLPGSCVLVVLDEADPVKHLYYSEMLKLTGLVDGDRVLEFAGNMIQRTNQAAHVADTDGHWAMGWMADDNRMRTEGWDLRVSDELHRAGVAFVNLNDLFWSEHIPDDKPVNTYMRTEVGRVLGWFANPALTHHFMDDSWRLLGISTDSIRYLRDVICEHMHPVLGKSQWDDGYHTTEHPDSIRADQNAFQRWVWDKFRDDRARLKAWLEGS